MGQLRAELASATSMVSAMASRVAELEKLLEAKLGPRGNWASEAFTYYVRILYDFTAATRASG